MSKPLKICCNVINYYIWFYVYLFLLLFFLDWMSLFKLLAKKWFKTYWKLLYHFIYGNACANCIKSKINNIRFNKVHLKSNVFSFLFLSSFKFCSTMKVFNYFLTVYGEICIEYFMFIYHIKLLFASNRHR